MPSALGGIEVYLFDLVQAYATLANGGVRVNPYAIQRIEDIQGNVVYEADPNPEGVQVVRPEYAYLMTSVLSDESVKFVAAESIPGWQAAAKTGTTNDNRDVWTLGYTTEVAVGVWVGRTDNQPMDPRVLGTNTAAPIWNKTFQAALAGLTPTDFPRPGNIADYQICPDSGAQFSTATCPSPNPRTEVAFVDQPPPPADQGFLTVIEVDGFSGLRANENCRDAVERRTFLNIDDLTPINLLNNKTAKAAVVARAVKRTGLPTASMVARMAALLSFFSLYRK